MTIVQRHIFIGNMSCNACATRIQRALSSQEGIREVRVSFFRRDARLVYDNALIKPKAIAALIEGLGYEQLDAPERSLGKRQLAGILLIILALWLIASMLGLGSSTLDFPLARSGAGYAALFAIGLLTSVHCLGMCGGISLSQCIPAVAAACGGSGLASF
jgi:copper chaperone CopZ